MNKLYDKDFIVGVIPESAAGGTKQTNNSHSAPKCTLRKCGVVGMSGKCPFYDPEFDSQPTETASDEFKCRAGGIHDWRVLHKKDLSSGQNTTFWTSYHCTKCLDIAQKRNML